MVRLEVQMSVGYAVTARTARCVGRGACLVALLAACNNTPVTIAPPRIPQGGRALSVAVAADDPRHMAVTSETGGLFRTYQGGASWQHLDGLPNHLTEDVAISWTDHNVMIATTRPLYRTVNDGGIWRSQDGGGTWTQPTGWAPAPGPGCPTRPGAYGISHMPLSTTFYIGTDCGIAVSNDNGVTWSNFVLDPTATGSDSLQNRVRSILVINRSSGVAAADRGLWHLGGAGTWTKSQDVQTSGQVPVVHAFASPWWSGNNPPIFYHASGGQMLWVSSDNGNTWAQVPAPSVNNREAFVRIGRSLADNDLQFEVWYGDGAKLFRQTLGFDALTGTNAWDSTTSDHLDPSDLAFDLEHRIPTLLATDGGVHVTPDSGATWKLIGSAFGGYVALQINEITGQVVTGSAPHLDLYFSTQDNDLKASPDGGQSWDPHICCEGHFLRVQPTSVDHQGTRFTSAACGPCGITSTREHFLDQTAWPNAPDGDHDTRADAPFLVAGDTYLQFVDNTSAMPPTWDFDLTQNAGNSWAKSYSLTLAVKGPAMIVGSAQAPTVYQAVRRPGSIPNGGPRYGLMRIDGALGQATVTRADSVGLGGVGMFHTPQGTYAVVGADPTAPGHLIAADVANGKMVSSATAGATWQPMASLTQAVTGNGQYLFTTQEFSFASTVAWDPYDGCHILVGTVQNGVMRSTDGGNTWAQVAGSKFATNISSFFFPPTGSVWMATNGRGLWTMALDRKPNGPAGQRCRFPGSRGIVFPVDSVLAINPATGFASPFSGPRDSVVCPRCTIVTVRSGWVTQIEQSDDNVRQIGISGGTISQVDRDGREVRLTIPNRYVPGSGQAFGKLSRGTIGEERRIRALVLDGTRLVRLIASRDELPFAPTREPMVFVRGSKHGGSAVTAGDSVRVGGTGFVAPSAGGGPVEILFDGQTVAREVPVAADGSFSVTLPVRRPPGELVVTAQQRDGQRTSIERASIDVLGNDEQQK